jgi:hypothetical protein
MLIDFFKDILPVHRTGTKCPKHTRPLSLRQHWMRLPLYSEISEYTEVMEPHR